VPVRIAHISDIHVARPPPADPDETVEYVRAFLVRALPVAAASVALRALSRPEIRSTLLGFLDKSKSESASRDVDSSKIVVGLSLALGLAAVAGAWVYRRELMELWHCLGSNDRDDQARLAILRSLRELDVDHLVITGDLTNTASDEEFAAARAYVDELRSAVPAGSVCILPGNHDVQTSTGEGGGPCLERFHRHFGDLLPKVGGQYPLSWQLGEVSLLGLNSCTEGVGFGTRGRARTGPAGTT
jgi:3',5'-cyclic AMP phosphodiesterase CpdA